MFPFFKRHLGLPQCEQKKIVDEFRNSLFSYLKLKLENISWDIECSPIENLRDTVDIIGVDSDMIIIIEIDKHRADQVAKKFISRTAIFVDKKISYISLCYPGTDRMSTNECIKYFNYCKAISCKLGNKYAGYIIQ